MKTPQEFLKEYPVTKENMEIILPPRQWKIFHDFMQEYSDQNTKQLIDEIVELKESLEINEKIRKENLDDFVKDINGLTDEIAKLKTSKSEANEAVESQDVLWDSLIDEWNNASLSLSESHILPYLKNKFTITRNNK